MNPELQKAAIRFSLPLLPLGALISAVSLAILWRVHKAAGIGVAMLLVGTNVLYLGSTREQLRHYQDSAVVRSTLLDYTREVFRDYESVYDSMVSRMRQLPPGTTVRCFPFFMAYPPMYQIPELHYGNQMRRDHTIRKDLRDQLPDYVYSDYLPEVCVVYGLLTPHPEPGQYVMHMIDVLQNVPEWLAAGGYQKIADIDTVYPVGERPEIPQRWFGKPERRERNLGRFLVYYRKDYVEQVLRQRQRSD